MSETTIYKCGTNVLTVVGNKSGIISEVSIKYNIIQYNISYYEGNEFKSVWLPEQELIVNGEKQRIGYKKIMET
jgi:hypothetical protein